MARERRQIGIRHAHVRLPTPTDIGPALVKTAAEFGNIAFERASDKRKQEAQIAAAKLNFERDGDGNLTAPALPLSDNGLLAPSIYDRTYTQMVSRRYLNQVTLDTKERLNLIATDNQFDPVAYRKLAEAYVTKVTELAPDILKPDVNHAAQVTMVEHFNRIIRETAERDHNEAREVHTQFIDDLGDELAGYVEAGADPEVISAKMLQMRAAIAEGGDVRDGGFGFWNDAQKAELMENIDKRYVLATMVAGINSVPDNRVAHAEAIKALEEFSRGDGTVPMIDALGNVYEAPVTNVYPDPADRAHIAKVASFVLDNKRMAFQNLRDERLYRDTIDFFTKYGAMAMARKTWGLPLDMQWLTEEYDKANANVVNRGYDDSLRATILGLIEQELRGADGKKPSQWEQDWRPGFENWGERYLEAVKHFSDGADFVSLPDEEKRRIKAAAYNRVGNVPNSAQTKDGAREIARYYQLMTGRPITQQLFEELIANPQDPRWAELEQLIPDRWARIGIWPKEVTDAITGKLSAPEGLQEEVLSGALRLARMLWDNPSFRANMQDKDALGPQIGGALDVLFYRNGALNADTVRKELENFSNPEYSPYANWRAMDDEQKEKWVEKARDYLEEQFTNNWPLFGPPEGLELPRFFDTELGGGGGLDPMSPQLAGINEMFHNEIVDRMKAFSGRMDPNDPDAFAPYLHRAVKDTMRQHGLAATRMGYDEARMNPYYDQGWPWLRGRPAFAIVPHAPEYFIADDEELSYLGGYAKGTLNREFVKRVEKGFQTVLNEISKQRWPQNEPRFKMGRNAGLRYSGISSAPDRFNRPSWHIVVRNDDGKEEVITRTGLWGDDPLLFHYDKIRAQYVKEKRQQLREETEKEAVRRRMFQQRLPLSRVW